jgi:hypothetical protein
MNRRKLLQAVAGAGLVGVLTERARKAEAQVTRATQGLPAPKIRDVSVIATAPAGLRLTVVKISTDQDGLYGYGCGTFTQRAELVNAAVGTGLASTRCCHPAASSRLASTCPAAEPSTPLVCPAGCGPCRPIPFPRPNADAGPTGSWPRTVERDDADERMP